MKNFIIFLFIFLGLSTIIWFFDNYDTKSYLADTNKIVKNINNHQNLTDDDLRKQIGQMIMVGFNGSSINEQSDVVKAIKEKKIGGVILFNRDKLSNIVSYQQTKKLINDLQSYSDIPLFIAVDAEGGKVNRLNDLIEIKSAYEMGNNKTNEITQIESSKLSQGLKNLGFNMNLAPVVDVNVNNNPAIGGLKRSFSNEPSQVTYQANNFILNHFKNNIIAVVKHFPGQGSALKDTHNELADITNTYSESELIPYQELNKKGLMRSVMVGHLINKNIDQNYPASLSSKFIQNILRQQIDFNGVVMTDDLQMSAIKNNFTFEESIVLAINAGADIVVATKSLSNQYDQNTPYKMHEIIYNNVKNGNIPITRINESYNRIIKLKEQFDIIKK